MVIAGVQRLHQMLPCRYRQVAVVAGAAVATGVVPGRVSSYSLCTCPVVNRARLHARPSHQGVVDRFDGQVLQLFVLGVVTYELSQKAEFGYKQMVPNANPQPLPVASVETLLIIYCYVITKLYVHGITLIALSLL